MIEFLAGMRGRSFDVLFEKPGHHPGQIVGRSPYLQPVQVMASPELIGEIHRVTVTDVGGHSLFGELANTRPAQVAEAQLAAVGA